MLFNPCSSKDFTPTLEINGHDIEVVEETKLQGVVITSDLKWSSNTDYIIKRANSKLWCLRRLKALGANQDDLLDVYFKQIRSIVEYAVPVWHSSLTGEDRLRIERIQKSALHITLGHNYHSYRSALKSTHIETLFERRRKLCKTFARKSQKHPKFRNWFKLSNTLHNTRSKKSKFAQVYSQTIRYKKSSLSYLTDLLNQ